MANPKVVASIVIILCLTAAIAIDTVAAAGSGSEGCRQPCEEECNEKHNNENREFCQMTCSTTCYNKPIIEFFSNLFASDPK
ncbi:hypothetical protein LINGRAHAP2_LOCUS15518 [Linum grandiflorum]